MRGSPGGRNSRGGQAARDGAEESTLAAVEALKASWTDLRYYAVDYDNGNDDNDGYSDISLALAGANPLKTIEELYTRIPPIGNNKKIVIVIMARAARATYLDQDGVTASVLDFSRYTGYRHFSVRGTDAWLNTDAEKRKAGFQIIDTGPGGGGVWTSAGSTTTTINRAAGNFSVNLQGRRVRFVTGALAGETVGIKTNTTTVLTLMTTLSGAPADGDTFVIDSPGVVVGEIKGMPTPPNLTSTAIGNFCQIVGIKAANASVFGSPIFSPIACEFGGTFTCYSATISELAGYADEADGFILFQCGTRYNDAVTILGLSATELQTQYNAFISTLSIDGAAVYLGNGSYFGDDVTLTQCRDASLVDSFGPGAGSGQLTAYLNDAALIIQGGNLKVRGAVFENCNGKDCIQISENAKVRLNNCTGSTGNTSEGISIADGRYADVEIGLLSACTVTGAGGDIRTADGVMTYASITGGDLVDSKGNRIQGSGTVTTRKLAPTTAFNVPVLAADPGTLNDGDVWIRDAAGTRQICTRIGGVTYRVAVT